MTPEERGERISAGLRRLGKNRLPRREVVLDTGEVRLYPSIHIWIRRHYTRGNRCWSCGTSEAKRIEWHHRDGHPWTRRLEAWLPLCSSCNCRCVRTPESEMPAAFGFSRT
jgi:hypothetical protein